MCFKTKLIIVSIFIFLGTGCATPFPPSPMTETEVDSIIATIKREYPREKLYRQYVGKGLYIQFERIDDSNVIYGWYTCTDCSWTRSKIFGVYDGSYLYIAYGHHEEFFLQAPTVSRMHPDMSHWLWGVVDKYQVEGRNLVQLAQYRKCPYDKPSIKEWFNIPWQNSDEINCFEQEGGHYNVVYVATTDDVLVGKRDSIVGTEKDNLKKKMEDLKELLDEGLIDQKSFDDQKLRLLNSL